jgi:hypothetical protein
MDEDIERSFRGGAVDGEEAWFAVMAVPSVAKAGLVAAVTARLKPCAPVGVEAVPSRVSWARG